MSTCLEKVGGEETQGNWITQRVIELHSCWTWKASVWEDENFFLFHTDSPHNFTKLKHFSFSAGKPLRGGCSPWSFPFAESRARQTSIKTAHKTHGNAWRLSTYSIWPTQIHKLHPRSCESHDMSCSAAHDSSVKWAASYVLRVHSELMYLIVEFAHEFEVFLSTLWEDHTVPLLGHQQTERQSQLMIQKSILQTLRRLLGVPDLPEVTSLHTHIINTDFSFLLQRSHFNISTYYS